MNVLMFMKVPVPYLTFLLMAKMVNMQKSNNLSGLVVFEIHAKREKAVTLRKTYNLLCLKNSSSYNAKNESNF